jgi:hypothetical protein
MASSLVNISQIYISSLSKILTCATAPPLGRRGGLQTALIAVQPKTQRYLESLWSRLRRRPVLRCGRGRGCVADLVNSHPQKPCMKATGTRDQASKVHAGSCFKQKILEKCLPVRWRPKIQEEHSHAPCRATYSEAVGIIEPSHVTISRQEHDSTFVVFQQLVQSFSLGR